jgi:hypothetical protein
MDHYLALPVSDHSFTSPQCMLLLSFRLPPVVPARVRVSQTVPLVPVGLPVGLLQKCNCEFATATARADTVTAACAYIVKRVDHRRFIESID